MTSAALFDVTSVALFDVTSVTVYDVTSVSLTAVALCDVTSVALFDGCRSTSIAVFDVTAVSVVESLKYLCGGFFGCACTTNVLSRGNGPSIRKLIDENVTCPQHERNGGQAIDFVCLLVLFCINVRN